MKPLLAVFFAISITSYGKASKDTIVTYYNLDNKACKPKTAVVIKKVWQDDTVWRTEQRWYPSNILQLTGSFSDQKLTIPTGTFVSYYDNGNKQSEYHYVNGQKDGEFKRWSEDGKLVRLFVYKQNKSVDTSYSFNSNGVVYQKIAWNTDGSNVILMYYHSGHLLSKGDLVEKQRNGIETVFAENGEKLGEVTYKNDSAVSKTCAHNKIDDLPCLNRHEPEVLGGNAVWRKFLQKNLNYPKFAQENGITGVVEVQFEIDTLGNTIDPIIISSPHSSLSKEVIRLFKMFPKSSPAVVHNQPIVMTGIQKVTFRLQ